MTGEEIDEDMLFTLLSSSRRRDIIRALAAQDEYPTDIGEVVDYVVRCEKERRPSDEIPPYLRNSIYNTSVQNHLPRLDDAAIIDFDNSEKELRPGPAFEVAVDVLEAAMDAFEEHFDGGVA